MSSIHEITEKNTENIAITEDMQSYIFKHLNVPEDAKAAVATFINDVIKRADKAERLKEAYVEARTAYVKASVPDNHCPYSYYPSMGERRDNPDGCDDCRTCKEKFYEEVEECARKEAEEI